MDESEIPASTSSARSSRPISQVRKMRSFKMILIYLFSMCVCITAHTWNSEDNLEGSPPSSHHVHLGESALAEVSLPRVPAQGVGLSTAWSGARIAGWSSRDTSLWRPQTPHRTLQFRVPFAPKLPRMAVVERALGVVGHRPSLLLPHPPTPC